MSSIMHCNLNYTKNFTFELQNVAIMDKKLHHCDYIQLICTVLQVFSLYVKQKIITHTYPTITARKKDTNLIKTKQNKPYIRDSNNK